MNALVWSIVGMILLTVLGTVGIVFMIAYIARDLAARVVKEERAKLAALPVLRDCRDCGWHRYDKERSVEWCAYPKAPSVWAHGGAAPPDDCPLRKRAS